MPTFTGDASVCGQTTNLLPKFSPGRQSTRLSRFVYELRDYDFTLHYKQGVSNHVPDLLSRPARDSTPSADMPYGRIGS